MRLAIAIVAVLSSPALADPAMTAADFAAAVGTDTITFGYSDGTVGTADYGPNQTLRWRYDGEQTCTNGKYRQAGELLCFDFETQDFAACWHFHLNATGLYGIGAEKIAGHRIFQIQRSDQPLSCAEFGV